MPWTLEGPINRLHLPKIPGFFGVDRQKPKIGQWWFAPWLIQSDVAEKILSPTYIAILEAASRAKAEGQPPPAGTRPPIAIQLPDGSPWCIDSTDAEDKPWTFVGSIKEGTFTVDQDIESENYRGRLVNSELSNDLDGRRYHDADDKGAGPRLAPVEVPPQIKVADVIKTPEVRQSVFASGKIPEALVQPTIGRMVHFRLDTGTNDGAFRPAMIVGINAVGVELDVFTQGPNDRFPVVYDLHEALHGGDRRQWHWPGSECAQVGCTGKGNRLP